MFSDILMLHYIFGDQRIHPFHATEDIAILWNLKWPGSPWLETIPHRWVGKTSLAVYFTQKSTPNLGVCLRYPLGMFCPNFKSAGPIMDICRLWPFIIGHSNISSFHVKDMIYFMAHRAATLVAGDCGVAFVPQAIPCQNVSFCEHFKFCFTIILHGLATLDTKSKDIAELHLTTRQYLTT